MFNSGKARSLSRRFCGDNEGNVTLMFAISAVAVIGCMGAAMDYSTLSSAKSKSQSIADQTALAAAIFVKDNGRKPRAPEKDDEGEFMEPEEGYLDIADKKYTANDLGYDFKGWVDGGSENVDVEVVYDDINREARVTVSGQTNATFMQVLGKQDLKFSARSTVKYQEYEFYDPASIVMVLDNSGSMSFEDRPLLKDEDTGDLVAQEGSQVRLAALKTHAKAFMKALHDRVGEQTTDSEKVLRTGMLAFNEATIDSRTIPMDWKIISDEKFTNMVASGGTNSSPPLGEAKNWLLTEERTHREMHGKQALEFLIFMTDGVNTDSNVTWVAGEDTGQWKGVRCKYDKRKNKCRYYYWDTVESKNEPTQDDYYKSYGWEEGEWVSTADYESKADCEYMKNTDGVKIYTIGFALAAGTYDSNNHPGTQNSKYIQDEDTRTQAYSLLSDCASSPSTFLTAENAEELEEAFETIGNDILTEIIRLSN